MICEFFFGAISGGLLVPLIRNAMHGQKWNRALMHMILYHSCFCSTGFSPFDIFLNWESIQGYHHIFIPTWIVTSIASIRYSSWIKHQTNPVNRQRGTLEKQAFETLCYNLFEIPKGNPQHFDDNTTMNAAITLWELLPKCQTITFIMNSNCKLPWLLPIWLCQLPTELPSTSYQQGWSHPWFRENNICGLYSLTIANCSMDHNIGKVTQIGFTLE